MSKTMTWLLAGAAFALTAGVAVAQDAAREAEQDAAKAEPRVERRELRIERGDRHRHHDHDVIVMRHGGRDRAEHLRTLLQLRPNQEGALKAFLDATAREHGPARDHFVRFERGSDSRTTTERLAEMEARLAEQQAATRKRIDATRAFYAQLDDKQRKVFDTMPMLMMAGPGFGPTLLPIGHRFERRRFPAERFEHPEPPAPPKQPAPPRS